MHKITYIFLYVENISDEALNMVGGPQYYQLRNSVNRSFSEIPFAFVAQ